jgi:toxin ParE1/3/4
VKPHIFERRADEEYTEALRYYQEIDPQLGKRFFDEIESLISDIRRAPMRFRIYDGKTRRHFSRIFPYAVIYLDQPDRVVVVSVMNMQREPGYWRNRIA